jgi:phosphoribosyl 1,2-cyclic phosphodiesterase
MRVSFYGTRGSLPVPGPSFAQYGGNTSCVRVTFETGRIAILDAGTGIRKLGADLIRTSHQQYDNIYLVLSHTHWDHIQGFPFFQLAYDARQTITLAIAGIDRTCKNLESIFTTQMQHEYFPVPLNKMGATFVFWQPNINRYAHPHGVEITTSKHSHPGGASSYRFTEGAKTLAYCTDVEHVDGIDPNIVTLAQSADLLIHDAQYTPDELKERKGWGHSSWEQAVEVARMADVKKLCLYHHDPDHDDGFLSRMEAECQERFPSAFLAREGMDIDL